MAYKTKETAVRWGKRDPICNALRAFYIVELENGRFDYYPIGTWPTGNDVAGVKATYILCNNRWHGMKNKK